jgi:peroxiredoxin
MRSLKKRLEAKRVAMPADVHLAYAAMVTELGRAGVIENVLRVGDRFPDFLLPNAEGDLVALDDLLARGALVVTFFRGAWCPYCQMTLEALAAAMPKLRAAHATLVAVTPETGGRALAAKRAHGEGLEVLSDVDCGLALRCGVVFRAPEPYRSILLAYGTDLAERHGNAAWFLPLPATFVLDRGAVVRWRFVSVDFTERAEPADIMLALRKISAHGAKLDP